MENSGKINIYWMEEQQIFQTLYRAIFTPESQVQVVNCALSVNLEIIGSEIHKNKPEIVLLGFQNLSGDMISKLEKVQNSFPSIGFVLLSSSISSSDFMFIRQYFEKVRTPFGFLLKRSINRTEQILNILSLVKMKQIVIDPTISKYQSTDNKVSHDAQELTPRELEILNLVSRGFTNIAISETLCIDVKTVRHHINNMYSKLYF